MKLSFKSLLDTYSKAKLDELFATIVYTLVYSFFIFTTPEWQAFFKTIGYIPPLRDRLAGPLLDQCYTKTKIEVEKVIASTDHIRVVADESTNINGDRIKNVSVIVNGILYH